MVLESYQAIYFLKIDGHGIIPGNILTYERGSSIKKEERLILTKNNVLILQKQNVLVLQKHNTLVLQNHNTNSWLRKTIRT